MSVTFPENLVRDSSLPESLASAELAYQYVGRKVCKWFSSEALNGATAAWHTGIVKSVDIDQNVVYLKVVYASIYCANQQGEAEGSWWEELFWDEFRQHAMLDAVADPPGIQTPVPAGHHQQPQQQAKEQTPGAPGRSPPHKRKSVVPPSRKVTHPGSELPPRGQGARRAGVTGWDGGGASHGGTNDDQDLDGEHEQRLAVRRRLDLEPDSEANAQQQAQQLRTSQPWVTGPHRRAAAREPPRRSLGGPEPFSAGQLHRIQLINFMCHENTEVKFNKHVTFVAGRNGSGKSALLQGLQACLGATARETGRGSNLAGWVARDKRTAVVTLELWNTTEEEVEVQRWPPFKPSIYGSMIRIVRKLTASEPVADGSRSGRATYQLFSADGKEVKEADMGHSARHEVQMLAEHFNIDASNPLIVITQDMARQFHQVTERSSRCKKYEMYMAGTCLTATRKTLAAAGENVRLATGNYHEHGERTATKRRELRELQERVKMLERVDGSKQQLALLELATVWAIVREARVELEAAKAAAAAHPRRVAGLEALVTEAEGREAALRTREAALRDEMENTRSDVLLGRVQELRARQQAARRRAREVERRLGELAGLRARLHDRRASQEEGLARLEAERASEGLLERVAEHEAKVAAQQAELLALQGSASQLEAARTALVTRMNEAEEALAEQAAALDAARTAARETREAHQELRQAAAAGGAAAAVNNRRWGAQVMELHRRVAAEPRGTFSQPPLGPLGLYLRLRSDCDPAMGPLVEMALRNVLAYWVVNRREDSDALRRLAGSIPRCPRLETIVAPFRDRLHDYGREPVVDAAGRLWRRVIDVVEPVDGLSPQVHATLINVLLDQGAAAWVALVNSVEEGQDVALGRVPELVARRVRRAYDRAGTSYTLQRGAMITDFIPELPRTCRLDTDNRAQMEESERAAAVRDAELTVAEAAWREAQEAVAAVRRERQELQQQQMALSRNLARCQSKLSSLLEEAPAAVSEAQSAELLNALQATQCGLAHAAVNQARLETERNNAAADSEAADGELEAVFEQTQSYRTRREELVGQLGALALRIQEAAQQLAVGRQQLAAARAEMQQAQARIDRFEAVVEQASAAATDVCSREEGLEALDKLREVKAAELRGTAAHRNKSEEQLAALLEPAMSSRGLQQWAAALSKQVSQVEAAAGGDLCSLRLQADAKAVEVEREKAALQAVGKKVAAMQEAQALRNAKYKKLVQQVEHLSNAKFARYMQRRNITASMQLDHENERLELRVRKNSEREQATSLMQLSGGERSFTTSAFLLAMGEVLDTPFRAMDEYDVYMDNNARKLATIALLEYAWKSNPAGQLVLLSPQDTATLTDAFEALQRTCQRDGEEMPPKNFVKIVKLRDPRPNQQHNDAR